ncbi:hypothetical protein Pint_14740 [Pistacia integerrima]|uniref:Uncharacterized protein n=1 Tax=Pistacia integerrima TaxID=434235 RepID=A0ACC0YBD3_9ROSI|nr:hypothetical protein Pint_14740 [Pistacia integerrima]
MVVLKVTGSCVFMNKFVLITSFLF